MATFDNVVNSNVITDALPVGRQGFGLGVIMDAAAMTERLLIFSSVAEAATAQTAGDITAAQLAAITSAFSQTPKPAQVGAGRLYVGPAVAQVVTIAVTAADDGSYTINVNGTDYTHPASSQTADQIATALAALVDADGAVGAVANVSEVVITASTPGTAFTFSVTSINDNLVATLTTPNQALGTVASELDALLAENSDWYGFSLVSRTKADIEAAAAWAEANQRFFAAQTSDADVKTTATTDVMSVLQDASYNYTKIKWYSDDSVHMMFALLCNRLSVDPDVQTTIWDFVTLAGITPDVGNITTTELNNIISKNGGAYLTLGGVGATGGGNKQSSGRFTDVQITVDWLKARLDEAHKQLLLDASNRGSKIPFTDSGFSQIGAVAENIGDLAVRAGHLERVLDEQGTLISPVVDLPARASISDPDVTARHYQYCFIGLLAGAVQRVTITAKLTDDVLTLSALVEDV